jgi:uncharacterized membrane protein (DUF485 family)
MTVGGQQQEQEDDENADEPEVDEFTRQERNSRVILTFFIIAISLIGIVLVALYGTEFLGSTLAAQVLIFSIGFSIFSIQIAVFTCADPVS